jgi:hypothetical protein
MTRTRPSTTPEQKETRKTGRLEWLWRLEALVPHEKVSVMKMKGWTEIFRVLTVVGVSSK